MTMTKDLLPIYTDERYMGGPVRDGDIVVVSLQGKIHFAHATKTVWQPNYGRRVPMPACGQKARRFHPASFYGDASHVTCAKCLAP